MVHIFSPQLISSYQHDGSEGRAGKRWAQELTGASTVHHCLHASQSVPGPANPPLILNTQLFFITSCATTSALPSTPTFSPVLWFCIALASCGCCNELPRPGDLPPHKCIVLSGSRGQNSEIIFTGLKSRYWQGCASPGSVPCLF